jgi:hypothetical protein
MGRRRGVMVSCYLNLVYGFLLRFWGRFAFRIERCDSKDAMGNVRGKRCEPLLPAPEIGIRELESDGLVQCRPFPFIDKDLPFMDTAPSLLASPSQR